MNVVDKAVVALDIDTNAVDKGLAVAQKKLITGLGGIVNKIFAPLLAGSVLSFGAMFDSISSEIKQMNQLSKATHTNIEDMTAWSRAIEMNGGSIDGFQQSLMMMNQDLTRIAVTGNSRIKPFFKALGLDATNLAKKPVLDSMEAISKAIEGMDKRQSADILRSMGFDAGTIKLLQSGEKNLRQLIARQKELGVYTEKDAKAISAMNKGFREITSAIKTLFIPAFSLVISVASRVTKYLTAGVLFLRKNLDAIKTVLLGVAIVMSGRLLPAFLNFLEMLMINPLGAFMATFGALFLLFDDLYTYAEGGESAFEEFWRGFGTPEEIMQTFDNAIKSLQDFLKLLGDFSFDNENMQAWAVLGALIGVAVAGIVSLLMALGAVPIAIGAAIAFIVAYGKDIVEAFKAIGKMIVALFELAVEGIIAAVKWITKAFLAAWDKIRQIVSNIVDWFEKVGQSIRTVFTNAANLIVDAFAQAGDGVSAIWEGIKQFFAEMADAFKNIGDVIVSVFKSAADAISEALSSAADSARTAWNSFITWLEQKWNWIKSLLPSLEGIANKLPGFDDAPKLASGGGGGNINNSSITNDNRNVNVNLHTAEATNTWMRNNNLTSYSNTGVVG